MGRGKVGTGKEKKWGKEKSRAKQECFSRVPPNGEERSGSWPISERQISEFVSCVLTPSSKRGSFVRHIASLFHRKCKALFLDNLFFLTVNVPRSLGTRRRICHVQVKNQLNGKFMLIERIVLLFANPVCFF